MLKSDREKRICEKYARRMENGKVGCFMCPLVINPYLMICKANSHYDRKAREFVPDMEREVNDEDR